MAEKKDYISLKEASEISGYSPDYIGQLIRSGKLPGKQVFQHVVWTTTEEDLRSYMAGKRGAALAKNAAGAVGNFFRRRKNGVEVPMIATFLLYVAIALSVILFLAVFYILTSSIELKIDEGAAQRLEAKSSL